MAMTLWPVKAQQETIVSNLQFHYKFDGRSLRIGDVVDGTWKNQFIYDAEVIRPCCPECGYDGMRNMDYRVKVRVGSVQLFLNRSEIFNVRRPYRTGDWCA